MPEDEEILSGDVTASDDITQEIAIEEDTELVEATFSESDETVSLTPEIVSEPIAEETIEMAEEITIDNSTVIVPATDAVETQAEAEATDVAPEIETPAPEHVERRLF